MVNIEKFLIEAKKQTYANETVEKVANTRQNSKDYEYKKDKMVYHDTYFWINQCVGINVAMPMFTLIAGFLFSYLYDKGKYQEL